MVGQNKLQGFDSLLSTIYIDLHQQRKSTRGSGLHKKDNKNKHNQMQGLSINIRSPSFFNHFPIASCIVVDTLVRSVSCNHRGKPRTPDTQVPLDGRTICAPCPEKSWCTIAFATSSGSIVLSLNFRFLLSWLIIGVLTQLGWTMLIIEYERISELQIPQK